MGIAGQDSLGNHVGLSCGMPVDDASEVVPAGYNDGHQALTNLTCGAHEENLYSAISAFSCYTQMRDNSYKCFEALWQRICIALPSAAAYLYSVPKLFGSVFYSPMGALLMLQSHWRFPHHMRVVHGWGGNPPHNNKGWVCFIVHPCAGDIV
eukprot:13256557-Ditylum_brightwellii.AAC.1